MKDFSSAEKELFRYLDTFYVRSVSAGFNLWKRERATLGLFRECIKGLKRPYILDVGCGRGCLLQKFYEEGKGEAFLVGLDISPQFLEIASRRSQFKGHKDVHFVRQDIQRSLPFKDESFDVVVASAVLEHLLDQTFVVKELARILKRDGHMVVHLPSPNNLPGYLLKIIDYVTAGRVKRFAQGQSTEPTLEVVFKEHGALGHVSELPYNESCRLFKENGLDVRRVERGSSLVGQHPAFDRLYPLFGLILLLEPLLDYLPYKHLFCADFLLLLKKGGRGNS